MTPDSEAYTLVDHRWSDYVRRLTDSYDASAAAEAERERWHTLYRLSTLIALVESEKGVRHESEVIKHAVKLASEW